MTPSNRCPLRLRKGANMKTLNRSKTFVSALPIGVLAITVAMRGMAQDLPKVYDASVPRERQIRLALRPCPAEVSSHAIVYLLVTEAYEEVREGRNGITCYV